MSNIFVNECNGLVTATKQFTEEWNNPTDHKSLDQYKIFLLKIVDVENAIEDVIAKKDEYEKEIFKQFKARVKRPAQKDKHEKSKS